MTGGNDGWLSALQRREETDKTERSTARKRQEETEQEERQKSDGRAMVRLERQEDGEGQRLCAAMCEIVVARRLDGSLQKQFSVQEARAVRWRIVGVLVTGSTLVKMSAVYLML